MTDDGKIGQPTDRLAYPAITGTTGAESLDWCSQETRGAA
jgi:hypothetical protein